MSISYSIITTFCRFIGTLSEYLRSLHARRVSKKRLEEVEKLNEILGGEALEHLKGGAPPVVVVQQNTNSIQGGDKHTTVVPNNVRPMGSGSVGEDDL